MNEITLGSPAYRQLARRHSQLLWIRQHRVLHPDEGAELAAVSAAMDKAEVRHGVTIADVVDDYALVMAAGDLGGAEL